MKIARTIALLLFAVMLPSFLMEKELPAFRHSGEQANDSLSGKKFVPRDRTLGATKIEGNQVFSGLPIVVLEADHIERRVRSPGWMKILTEYSHFAQGPYPLAVNFAGNTALEFSKKSYRIQVSSEADWTSSVEIPLLDLGSEDDWKLRAMTADTSTIREMLNYEIFNRLSGQNDNCRAEFKQRYVHLFLENKYNGLYLLQENIGRKTFDLGKLEKSEWVDYFANLEDKATTKFYQSIFRSIWRLKYKIDRLFKTTNSSDRELPYIYKHRWEGSNMDLSYGGKLKEQLMEGVQQRYPKMKYAYYTAPYEELIRFINNADDQTFEKEVFTRFDRGNLRAYITLILINSGADNTVKNYILYRKVEGKNCFFPWDLDMTFGFHHPENGRVLARSDAWTLDGNVLFKRLLKIKSFKEELLADFKRENFVESMIAKLSKEIEVDRQLNHTRWGLKLQDYDRSDRMIQWYRERKRFVLGKLGGN